MTCFYPAKKPANRANACQCLGCPILKQVKAEYAKLQ